MERLAHRPGRSTLVEQQGQAGAHAHGPMPGKTTLVEQRARVPLEVQLDRTAEVIPADEGIERDAKDAAATTNKPSAHESPAGTAHDHPRGLSIFSDLGVTPVANPTDEMMPRGDDASAGDTEHAELRTTSTTAPAAAAAQSGDPGWEAKEDSINRRKVESNDKSGNAKQKSLRKHRPGVRFYTQGAVDVLLLDKPTYRYVIDASKKLHRVGSELAKGTHVAFNLAPPQSIGGTAYALTFVDKKGSFWTPLSAFRGWRDLESEIADQSDDVAPHLSNKSIAKHGVARREFISASGDDGLSELANQYILPGQKGDGNLVKDYRYHTTTHVYNVCLNLPQPKNDAPGQEDAAPTAIDVARPGWSFFVVKGADFRRQTPTFAAGSSEPGPLVTFVFGYLGIVRDKHLVPDIGRGGWVLQGVLKRP